MPLQNLRIVLVRPSLGGNVGGVARAMHNMGLSDLWLVAPDADFRGPDAVARAAGADLVLERARVADTLPEALIGCGVVVGTSARSRTIPWPMLTPRQGARRLIEAARQAPAALVFGAERTGLTNAELDHCHALVTIPANPEFSSLNLACAVQVMAYELRVAAQDDPAPGLADKTEPADIASADQVQRFYQHLEQVLIEIEFLDPEQPRKLMRRLMRLFNRVQLDQNEVNILRGILTAVQQPRRRNNI